MAHATLVAEACDKTAGEKAFGKTRHHTTDDISAAACAQSQHVVAGNAPEPAAELLQHLGGDGFAGQAGSGDLSRRPVLLPLAVQLADGAVQNQQTIAAEHVLGPYVAQLPMEN